MVSVNDMCQMYEESMSSVLGNYFVFGGKADKEEVRDVISNVVDLVMEAKGERKVWQIFFPHKHTNKFLPA